MSSAPSPGRAPDLSLALGPGLTYHDVTHRYYADGRPCRSFTNVAKIITDSNNVDLWRLRMGGVGLAMRPDLIEDIAAHVDDNARLDEIMQKAIDHAGANKGSQRGTQAHAASERHDRDLVPITEQQARDAAVWRRTVEAYGIEVDVRLIECIGLYPDDLVAGRPDRLAWVGIDGVFATVDLKTGWSSIRYPHATSVQLALQANAPLLSATTRRDGEHIVVDQWYARPEMLSREVGYVLRMPTGGDADTEVGTLFRFDLTGKYAGISAVHTAMAARHFQLAKPEHLCRAIEVPVRPAPGGYRYFEASPDVVHLDVERERRRLIERIQSLSDVDKAALRAAWTADLGNVQASMTAQQVEAAHALVDRFDPFMVTVEQSIERHPSNQPPAVVLDLPTFDEGEPVDHADILALADTYARLPDTATEALLALRLQAQAVGADFHLGSLNSERRYHLVRGLVTLAVNDSLELDALQGIASFVTGKDWPYQAGITPGHVVGHLGAREAEQFSATASMLVSGLLAAVVDEQGRFRLTSTSTTTS